MPETPESNVEERSLSRRGLIKSLAAAGGALGVAAFLPAEWVKPVVEAGVLPGHAQSTNSLRLVGELLLLPDQTRAQAGQLPLPWFSGEMQYRDDLAQITKSGSSVLGSTMCTPHVSTIVDYVSPERATSGIVGFRFATSLCNSTTTEFCVQLTHGGRTTNTLCGILPAG